MEFWKNEKSSEEVYLQVQSLFNDLELLEDFKRFLPSSDPQGVSGETGPEGARRGEGE
jgi:histone deacetylase complex regulatory component SIN3